MYDNQTAFDMEYAVVWYSSDHDHGTHLCETRQAAQQFILNQMPSGLEGLIMENQLTLEALCGSEVSPFRMVRVLCIIEEWEENSGTLRDVTEEVLSVPLKLAVAIGETQ